MKRLLYVVVFMASATTLMAQQGVKEDTIFDKGTIAEQYDFLIEKGANYDINGRWYEGIRITYLDKFGKNLKDTLQTTSQAMAELKNTIAENTTEIDGIKSRLSEATENLNNISEEKDSISLFGALVSKGTYKGIVWASTLALLFLLAIFVYKFRNSNYLTQQAKSALTNLEEEFEQHRRRALEREQKISRQLQDEINKQKGKN